MKDAMLFRMALFPYLYSENHRTRTTGIALMHPLYYETPSLDKSYDVKNEYFFGSSMLVQPIVAPITDATSITQTTWLPPGVWFDWAGQGVHDSGATGLEVSADYSIHDIPMFVRAGSVIPMRTSASLKTTLAFSDPVVWGIWGADSPLVARGNATVVEDDGATLGFEAGQVATTAMEWTRGEDGALSFTVRPTSGSFDVGCTAEHGVEYGGTGADLEQVGIVESEGACCDACATYSNCAFWTWTKTTKMCALKVSRVGRRANSSTVSGVAPRRMPATRAHVFQVRKLNVTASTTVTINGKLVPSVPPPTGRDEATVPGWYVHPKQAVSSLLVSEGSLVIMSADMPIRMAVEVKVV